jgi:hypothetical protein
VQLAQGDRVLFILDCYEGCAATPLPLEIEAPATANAGEAVTVNVHVFHKDGSSAPVSGVSVAGGGASAPTGSDGRAVLVFPQPGPATLVAQGPGAVRTEAAICVHRGNDGTCGSSLPSYSSTGFRSGTPSPYTAALPDEARVAGVHAGAVYSRRHAPRLLAGAVTIPAGKALREVRIALQRRVGRRCWSFSGARAEFGRARCGTLTVFSVGDEQAFTYLLPSRLPRGAYTYEVQAIDGAGHSSPLVTGASRVTFRVL